MLSRRDIPCLPSSVITTNTGKGAGRGGGGPRAGGRVQQTLASPQEGPQTISRFTSAQGKKVSRIQGPVGHRGTVRQAPHPPGGAPRPQESAEDPQLGTSRSHAESTARACCTHAEFSPRAAQKAAAKDYMTQRERRNKCRSRSPKAHAHSCERDRDTNDEPGESNQRRHVQLARYGDHAQQSSASRSGI